MQQSKLDRVLPGLLAVGSFAIIILVPFHATLTVWTAQVVGHYTALRLWKEALLVPLVLGALYMLARNPKLHHQITKLKLTPLILLYLVIQMVWGTIAYLAHHVTAKALGYGLVINTRFLIFFLVAWVIAAHVPKLQTGWQKVVFWPAAIVTLFGLLQYFVLPYDFLKHLGYSTATIFPYEDINHNVHYIRIMSTLRGANPLGAYLVVALSLLLAVWQKWRKLWYLALAAGSTATLILSFSRAAWIGFGVGVAVLAWASVKSGATRKLTLIAVTVGVLSVASAAFALRHNATLQNVLLHTQENSTVKTTSNEGHASAFQNGLHDIIHEPLGRGPGTAGPASVYNSGHPGRIAENYYIQLAQETGWIGLALFVAVNLLVAKKLWRYRDQPLALGLLAALAGVGVINLFSHAWTDDTLAYVWWGLAGIALVPAVTMDKGKSKA